MVNLVLTACKDTQFTCDESRCDRKEDCSVRILVLPRIHNCKLISFDPSKYVKNNPPQPLGNQTKVGSTKNNVTTVVTMLSYLL